jgi:N-acylneuraminate cytidylyltransferase
MKRMALIPARSGSKGLKDKNIIDLCGKPLMAYSIEPAIESGLFDQVIVSTDSEHYADIARRYGSSVIMRCAELASDTATSFEVIADVLHRQSNMPDELVLLQPTSPMRTVKHIHEAVSLFESNWDDFDFLVSVKQAEHVKDLVNMIDDDMSLKYFDKDFSNYRRQAYHDYSPNGAFFMAKPEAYLKQKHFFGARSIAYMMSDVDSVDIDHALDYELAKIIMNKRLHGKI